MDYVNPEALVSTRWLADHLDSPGLRVVDGSWHMPQLKRDARAEFEAGHIPGAVYFDIDRIADRADPLPHMLPDAATFARDVGALGIGNDAHVVAYDTVGVGSAARVWWTFHAFGHENVSVLDGGLPKWLAEGRPVARGPATPRAATYKARLDAALVRGLAEVRAAVANGSEQILDARSRGRFAGTEPEPRAGLRGGHMSGALSQPYLELYEGEAKTMKQAADLRALFKDAGLDLSRPVVTSCGSGVTACNLALALHLIGKPDVAVYDGSWTEWGGRDDTPIET